MATPTYDLLDSTTLGTSAASFTFSGIDQSYGDLILVISGSLTSNAGLETNINSDATTSNYARVLAAANGASIFNSAGNSIEIATASTNQSVIIINFMDYAATNKQKTYLSRSNGVGNLVQMLAGRWKNTSAITSIKIFDSAAGADFTSGTTFHLYGVAA